MRYDVIIIGSGPAGTSTALHLARQCPQIARRTLVLERDRHPRHKLCGGGCVPDVDVCLGNLGLDIRDVPHVDAAWANLNFRGRGSRLRLSDIAFHVVRRNEFDGWLAGKVREQGIRLQEETRVLKLRPIDQGIEVQTDRGTYQASVVVGADGTNSMVRRMLVPGPKTKVARLVELLTPPAPSSGAPAQPANQAFFEFAWAPRGVQGYVWSFPTQLEGRPMRNWGVYDCGLAPGPSGGSLRTVIDEWLACEGYRLDEHELEGHPIRLFDRRASFAAPHVLLAGDAAGVDAVFGEGISPALGYGELAARAIQDAFDRQDFSFAGYRQSLLASPLGRNLSRRTWTARMIYRLSHPRTQKLLWWRLSPVIHWYLRHFVFNWARPDTAAETARPETPRPRPWAQLPHWRRSPAGKPAIVAKTS